MLHGTVVPLDLCWRTQIIKLYIELNNYIYFICGLLAASWFKGDVVEIIEEALASGGDPNISDAFLINGQPGDLYDCSNGNYNQRSKLNLL